MLQHKEDAKKISKIGREGTSLGVSTRNSWLLWPERFSWCGKDRRQIVVGRGGYGK